MELPNQEGHMPLPINSSYGGGHAHVHGHAHNHILPSYVAQPPPQPLPSNGPIKVVSSSSNLDQDHVAYKKTVKYKECLKNHAASMGGNAIDGCGEFMPSGEEGTLEALTCSACNCHRNFHRKEIEGEVSSFDNNDSYPHPSYLNMSGRKMIMGHQKVILGTDPFGYHPNPLPSRVAKGYFPSESDEQEGGGVLIRPPNMVKKRNRTKFSQEQKEKMLNFAEKSEWKIQKQEESVVQQFCQEIGVRRRVLKVWMHNNKHNLARKNSLDTPNHQV